jgi:hypothetical protein
LASAGAAGSALQDVVEAVARRMRQAIEILREVFGDLFPGKPKA